MKTITLMKSIFTIILCCLSISLNAVTPKQMRFHCENDTLKINDLLHNGYASKISNPESLTAFYADKLLDTPYVGHTLEGETECLTINIDELDCTTFVETLIALTKTTLSGRKSWRDFANNLENIRYRRGEMDKYSSRLHYISDWIMDNSNRGNLKEITSELPHCSYDIKTINFMTQHRDSYPALKDEETFKEIKNAEIGYRSHRFPYIKKEYLIYKDVKKDLKDGYIIALTSKIEGLDVSHMGIIFIKDGEPYLLHASSSGKKVMIGPENLRDMLRRSKSNTGIRVIKINE